MLKNALLTLCVIALCITTGALTLDDAIAIGLKNNPTIKSAEASLMSAKYDYYQSNFDMLPTASFTGGLMWYEPSNQTMLGTLQDAQSFGVQANLPIFAGGKVWLNSRIKKNVYDIATDSYSLAQNELIGNIENKFFLVLEMKKMHEIASKEYNSAKVHEEIAEVRHKNGTLTEADLLRMKSITISRRVRMIQTHTNYLTAIIDLKSTLGVSEDFTPVDIPDEVFTQCSLDVLEWDLATIESVLYELSNMAIINNMAIQINQKAIDNTQKVHTMAMGNFLPSVALSFRREWQKSNLQDEFSESGTLMLSASVPIFPVGNNVSNLLKNKANLRKAEFDAINLQNTVSLTVRTVALAWITAIQSTESARISLEFAERSWEQMNQRYVNGIITSTDMLDADVMLSNANFAYTNARYNILRHLSTLKQLLFMETDEEFFAFIDYIK
jgi:outer membrane protein TolC